MHINSTKLDREVHRAHVDQDVALRLVAERVAEKLGVSLDGEGVSWRGWVTKRDTSHGIFTDVEIEIIDDHTLKPVAA